MPRAIHQAVCTVRLRRKLCCQIDELIQIVLDTETIPVVHTPDLWAHSQLAGISGARFALSGWSAIGQSLRGYNCPPPVGRPAEAGLHRAAVWGSVSAAFSRRGQLQWHRVGQSRL